MAGERTAAVVRHHVAQRLDEIDRGAAFGPVQLEVGPVEIPHDPFGIKEILELSEVGGPCGLHRGQARRLGLPRGVLDEEVKRTLSLWTFEPPGHPVDEVVELTLEP